METIPQLLDEISGFLWGFPMIILLFGTHLYLTVRLRFPQRKIFTAIRLSVSKEKGRDGDVSQFGALATALAATIGTGNIIGVGTAIALGGPGAVLWCWLTGVFGIATKYGEGLLAVKYRKTSSKGHMIGGPMYALEYGLNAKWAGVLFALFTCIASLGIGSTVQANAISTIAQDSFGVSPWVIAPIITLLLGLAILGGIKGIAKVCTALVPFSAIVYVLGCIVIMVINAEYIWPAIKLICVSAFTSSSAVGGAVGSSIMLAARYGIARGLFSNESGLGSAPIVAASAKTRNPVRQALVSSSGTFWDTVVVCAITGIVIVSCILDSVPQEVINSGSTDTFAFVQQNILSNLDGGKLTTTAFSQIPFIGKPLLFFGLVTFAFTTVLGWAVYSQRAAEYLFGYRFAKGWLVFFVATVFCGAIMSLSVVWSLADIFNALMAIPNLIALIFLSNVIAKDTDKFLWSGNLDEEA